MSTENHNFESFAHQPGIIKLTTGEPTPITPGNPLIINFTPANFDAIEISGGQIYTQGKTDVTINSLTKK